MGKPCDSSSLPRLQATIRLSWAIFLWQKMPHNSPGLQGAEKLQIETWGVGGFFFFSFKAAAVRIKGNLESLKRKSRNTRCLLTSIASSIFSLPWLLLNSNVIVFKVTFIILHAQSCLILLQPNFYIFLVDNTPRKGVDMSLCHKPTFSFLVLSLSSPLSFLSSLLPFSLFFSILLFIHLAHLILKSYLWNK